MISTAPIRCMLTPALTYTLASSSKALLGFCRGFASSNSSVIDLKDDKEFDLVVKKGGDGLAIVDFTAKWCGPCKAIAPIYEQLSKDHPTVKFTKVDIDNPDLGVTVTGHGISGVPTFVLYKGGKQLESFTGAQKDLLVKLISKHK